MFKELNNNYIFFVLLPCTGSSVGLSADLFAPLNVDGVSALYADLMSYERHGLDISDDTGDD